MTAIHDLDASAWLAAIVASSDDAIVGKRLDSTVVSWNAGAERIFGWTAAEMIGRPILTIFPPERYPEEQRIIAQLVRGERVEHFETQRRHKSGRLIDVSISVSPILGANGRIVGAVKIARDITEAKEMEETMRDLNAQLEEHTLALERANQQLRSALAMAQDARQAAESASAAKSEFLAAMSHELRTPLNAISGYAGLMQAGIAGPLPPDYAGYLTKIQAAQHHLQQLIGGVLDFSRLSTGKFAVREDDVDVADVFEEVESLVQPQAAAKGVTLRFAQPAHSLDVRADRDRTVQILLNLITNAVKFTPSSGAIDVDAARRDDVVAIRVRDTGPGIAPEDHERVFEPFTQLDRSLTRRHEGVGLGLAISRDLARAMRGDVRLSSTPGEGATFVLTLPPARVSAERR